MWFIHSQHYQNTQQTVKLQVVPAAEGQMRRNEGLLRLSSVPMATSCAIYDGHIITDPDAEEEALAASTLTSVVDGTGTLIGSPQTLPWQDSGCLRASTLHAKHCICDRSASRIAKDSK